ncbi:MAG: hypothetical protein DCC53_06340 [Chloroflexi bacterium]|nr:MAG: hypothetical protein DCC53_06340 [Chloroflexota bacterium]
MAWFRRAGIETVANFKINRRNSDQFRHTIGFKAGVNLCDKAGIHNNLWLNLLKHMIVRLLDSLIQFFVPPVKTLKARGFASGSTRSTIWLAA